MRILQLVQKPQRRGAEIFAWQLTHELRQQGHDVRIVYLYAKAPPPQLPLDENDRVLDGVERHVLERIPGFHPRLLTKIRDEARAFAPDIIQLNGARTLKYGAFLRRFVPNATWALVYRNIGKATDWVTTAPRRLFYRNIVIPKLDGIVSVSEASLASLRSLYTIDVPTAVIPRAVSGSHLVPQRERERVREEARTPTDAPVVVYVGSLSREKRIDRLLRVVVEARKTVPRLHAWIVGDGPERAALETQVRSSGLEAAVHFWGSQADVASLLAASDVFALTSDTEGIPGALLEGAYLGLPSVATRVGGVAQCVDEGRTGFLFETSDERGLGEALARLTRNDELREQLGENARAWVLARFHLEVIAARYVQFYESVRKHRSMHSEPVAKQATERAGANMTAAEHRAEP